MKKAQDLDHKLLKSLRIIENPLNIFYMFYQSWYEVIERV